MCATMIVGSPSGIRSVTKNDDVFDLEPDHTLAQGARRQARRDSKRAGAR